jgi:hypothetical protein
MYRNLQSGNVSGNYSVKNISTALARMKPAALMFYTIPGPKMLWEFGEFGYDQSINTCVNSSIADSCRLTSKPVLWTAYLQDQNRTKLKAHIVDLIRLRKSYDLFSTKGVIAQMTSGSSNLVQQISLKNSPYTSSPADSSQMNAAMVANFDVNAQNAIVSFPHDGTWYDYYNQNAQVNVTSSSLTVTLQAGDYKLYTDVKMKSTSLITAVDELSTVEVTLFPNPTHTQLQAKSDLKIISLIAKTSTGAIINPIRIDENTWDVNSFSSGLYIIEIVTDAGTFRKKIIKN